MPKRFPSKLSDLVNGKGGSSDQFGLEVWTPGGVKVLDISFAPKTLTGGNVVVPHSKGK